MTVSAADAAVPVQPGTGAGGKRSAEGGDIFAALVAGLIGPVVVPEPVPAAPGAPAGPLTAGGEVAIDAAAPQLGLPMPAVDAETAAFSGEQQPAPAAATPAATAPAAPATAVPAAAAPDVLIPTQAAPAGAKAQPMDVPVTAPRPEIEAAVADAEVPRADDLPEAPALITVEAPLTGGPSQQPQPTAVREVAVATPVVEARPTAPTAPVAQVAAVVAPVLQGPDGSNRVTMHLQPEALGNVAVTIDLREGSVSMHLRAAEVGTADLLRESLDELRSELDRQGLSMGTLDVSTGDRPGGRAARDLDRPATPAESSESTPTAPTAPLAPSTSGRPSALDVQL